MLIARAIRVFSLERDAITISWEIADTPEDINTYTVSVWRSESASGPYQRVSMEMNAGDVYEMEDRSVNILSKWREFFYRIRLTHRASGTYQDYGSVEPRQVLEGKDPGGVIMEAPPDLEALEAIRRFDLVLREYAGRRVLYLSSRSWGQYCGECWDQLKRRRNISGCHTCFDVGYAGGYFFPFQTFCMKPPHEVVVQLTPLFEMQPLDALFWFGSKPRVKPRDLIIDIEGRRWHIIGVRRSEKGWALTRQIAQARMISRDQIEYEIPIRTTDWPVNNLTAGAMRQHIRATDLDSYYKAVRDLGLSEQEILESKTEIATNLEDSNAGS